MSRHTKLFIKFCHLYSQVSQDGSGNMESESGLDDKGKELSHVYHTHTKSAEYLAFHIMIMGILCLRRNCQEMLTTNLHVS
jgi:hypothetical protein